MLLRLLRHKSLTERLQGDLIGGIVSALNSLCGGIALRVSLALGPFPLVARHFNTYVRVSAKLQPPKAPINRTAILEEEGLYSRGSDPQAEAFQLRVS